MSETKEEINGFGPDVQHLKIWPDYYDAVKNGSKTFEVRINDRDFKQGQIVILRQWSPAVGYIDSSDLVFTIGYVYPIDNEMVVFSLLPIERQPDEKI